MIILGYIEIHPKGCIEKIIVKRLMILLILHFQIQRILVKAELDVHVWIVKIKSPSN
jgi:hypothetical protein